MTDKLKCPFCGRKLEQYWYEDFECWYCPDVACKGYVMTATKDMWQELIRTRKALDKAKNGLKELKDIIACPPDISYETGVSMYSNGVLQEITALEQKESAFAHNKIEFPEYNDGLLEEFDKQFFENGQDDDLTETALEQKDERCHK